MTVAYVDAIDSVVNAEISVYLLDPILFHIYFDSLIILKFIFLVCVCMCGGGGGGGVGTENVQLHCMISQIVNFRVLGLDVPVHPQLRATFTGKS